MWLFRRAALPCPLLLLVAGCTPPAGLQPPTGNVAQGAPEEALGPSGQGRFYALGQALAREQQRTTALQAQLDERAHQIEQLQAEVTQLRDHETALQSALDRAATEQAAARAAAHDAQKAGASKSAAGETPAETTTGNAAESDRAHATEVASLRTSLAQEKQRRQKAESELTRLKEETSTPALADAGAPGNDLAAAKREIADLRTTLADERAARTRLAAQLHNLERRAAPSRTPDATPQDADLRARLKALEEERQAAVDSFNRSLTASQEHTAELERQLAAERETNAAAAAAPSVAGEVASIRSENTALRERLDEEHRRTEQLAAKLKLATRVTDLIFKMQSQQGQEPPPVEVPRADGWLDR
ncbi:MAG: hypothetical protein ACHQ4J_10115 [Candidatus Binatia bacterium]